MKTAVVFHRIDLDGWMSAAIAKKAWMERIDPDSDGSDSCTYLGFNYGDPIPNLSEFDKVIMCDISLPKETMIELSMTNITIVWCDHHISAINDSKDEIYFGFNGLRDTKFAACELTWMYFFPNEPMPELVRLLGRYDCFGHKGTLEEKKVLEFQYGARGVISNMDDAYDKLCQCTRTKESEYWRLQAQVVVGEIHAQGIGIYKFLCADAQQTYNNGFEIEFFEHLKDDNSILRKFICFNKERFNPINFGLDYHAKGYDGAACFHACSDGQWSFSLYNDNGEVDCSVIAKSFGGGGHKGASGFRIGDIEAFFKFVNHKTLRTS